MPARRAGSESTTAAVEDNLFAGMDADQAQRMGNRHVNRLRCLASPLIRAARNPNDIPRVGRIDGRLDAPCRRSPEGKREFGVQIAHRHEAVAAG